MVVSLPVGPPPPSRAFRVLGLTDLERRLLQSAYTHAITDFCMARGHEGDRGGHTDHILFVIDTGCTQHTVRGPLECMTHYKTGRKKISTAVANGVLWAEGIGNCQWLSNPRRGTSSR